METTQNKFQAVACCSLDANTSIKDSILKYLDLNETSVVKRSGLDYYQLKLENKYYTAAIYLYDLSQLEGSQESSESVLSNTHAIMLYANGQTVTTSQLDDKIKQLDDVSGEPRVLLCGGIDEECEAYQTLLDWSMKNGYSLIETGDECLKTSLIESLSAYKWPQRQEGKATSNSNQPTELNEELVKKLNDFENLLGKLSAYRDKPSMRGDPNDGNIVEIAEILSGLLNEDGDNFLNDEDDVNDDVRT